MKEFSLKLLTCARSLMRSQIIRSWKTEQNIRYHWSNVVISIVVDTDLSSAVECSVTHFTLILTFGTP